MGVISIDTFMNLTYSSSLSKLCEANASFDSGVLRVAHTNGNRNGSYISKATFERCMQSIYNCPVVCRYDRETDEIGGHDLELAEKDGQLQIINVTQPVGIIPESSQVYWENIEEEDGSVHEYLCVDVLLWKRQEAYQKIKANGITEESMEISIKEGTMKDGVFVIENFEFTAFCLLGTVEPCFPSSSLLMFSKEDFKAQLDDMMREFKDSVQNYSKGENKVLDQKKELMAQYGLSKDMLDFSIEDFTLEELSEKFEAITAAAVGDPEEQPADQNDDDAGVEETFALAEQFRGELTEALSKETVETCFGEMSRYWYMDYDGEAMEVYCYDQKDWKLYGFSYSMNGDNVIVDFDSKKRKKMAVVDFDEGEQQAAFADVFSAISTQYADSESKWTEKYQTASDTIATLEGELNSLRKFKDETEQSAMAQAREDIFAQFEDLAGIEAFEALRESCEKYSTDDLEEKCFSIRGRKQSGKFSLQTKAPKLPIEKSNTATDPYGGIFAKYGIESTD